MKIVVNTFVIALIPLVLWWFMGAKEIENQKKSCCK
jgi:plastocyanin domain-containing protein